MKNHVLRIYPSAQQIDKLWKHANAQNRLYNHFLDEHNAAYAKYKQDKANNIANPVKPKSKFGRSNDLPNIKKGMIPVSNVNPSDIKSFLKTLNEIPSQTLQAVSERLGHSLTAFSKSVANKTGNAGFPKFRSCKNFFGITLKQKAARFKNTQTLAAGQSFKKYNAILYSTAYGNIPVKIHKQFDFEKIKQIHIYRKHDKWFACVTTSEPYGKTASTKQSVGIDVGITNIAATSNGEIIKNKAQRDARYFNKIIARLQRKRAKCKKNSRRSKYLNRVTRKLSGVKSRKILDFQHKVSTRLTEKYDTIFIEDLSVKEMSESDISSLNREIRDASMGQFLSLLKSKAEKFVEIDPHNTSKTCNICGKVHKNLTLAQRQISCKCGSEYDRDINAAKNIYCLGQAVLAGARPGVRIGVILPYVMYLRNWLMVQPIPFLTDREAPAFRFAPKTEGQE